MLRRIPLRLALPIVLAAALLPAAAFAQSQDAQSVAEAARRARAQKKNSEKPAKVITDETLDVKKGDVQSATAEQPRIPGTPETQAQPTPANEPSSAAQSEKKASEDEKLAKELAALKEQIKQAQSDLDLVQREQSLQQDTYFSNTDYIHDTAGKAKLDALKQQISDKQQELDRLKARLAELQPSLSGPASTPPKL
jgi:chromosome segregation ATPase